jgi:hypothetical protein
MATLTDLHVDTVSFVSRAAVRDPQRKDEPRRLLLWKSQDAHSRMAQEAIDKAELAKREAVAAREVAEKSQKEAEAKLTKAATNITNKEKTDMSSTVTEPNLSLADQQTIARALSLLETVKGRPTVDDAIGELRGTTEGPEDENNEPGDDWSSRVEKLAKALIGLDETAVELRKDDRPAAIAAAARNNKAKEDAAREYAYLMSPMYSGERGEIAHAVEKRECGVGWKER